MNTWLYHRTEPARIFATASEVEEALADGWADTPAAFDGTQDTAGDDIDDLRAQALARGIEVDKRWGIPRLKKELAGNDNGV